MRFFTNWKICTKYMGRGDHQPSIQIWKTFLRIFLFLLTSMMDEKGWEMIFVSRPACSTGMPTGSKTNSSGVPLGCLDSGKSSVGKGNKVWDRFYTTFGWLDKEISEIGIGKSAGYLNPMEGWVTVENGGMDADMGRNLETM